MRADIRKAAYRIDQYIDIRYTAVNLKQSSLHDLEVMFVSERLFSVLIKFLVAVVGILDLIIELLRNGS